MDILHVYKDYFPVVGGIENHVQTLCTGLHREPGLSASVLVTNRGRRTVREVRDGVPVTKAARIATVASAPLSLALFREIGRRPHDVIHLHFPYPIGELAYLVRGRARRLVITYHSDVVRQKNLLRLYAPFLWRVLARADRIVVASPSYVESSLYLRRFRDRCRVIPFGIDLDRFRETPERRARAAALRRRYASDGAPLVLFVGLLRYYKGVEYLIEALRDLPERLLVVGEGPTAGELRSRAQQLTLTDKVLFLGRVPDDDLVAYYRAADVFALPSTHRSEAFGIVLLEAMACGRPLVSTELGTGTSFVNRHGETGLVVPPRDSPALAAALSTLLANPTLRQQMGEQARRRAEREFSAPVMVRRTVDLYRELLGGDQEASRV